jgi:hypothetical protein
LVEKIQTIIYNERAQTYESVYLLADNVLNQAFFGLYEFFANIIPGVIVTTTLILFFQNTTFSGNSLFSETLQIFLFIIMSFIIGLTMQALSSILTRSVPYPSKFYLEKDDNPKSSWYFPQFMKDIIRKRANQMFDTPINAPSQEVFDTCLICLLQNKVQTRIQTFQHLYTLARCMISTMIVESIIFMGLSFHSRLLAGSFLRPFAVSVSFQIDSFYMFIALGAIGLAVVFLGLFKTYQKVYAKEVLKSFYIYSQQQESYFPDYHW